MIPEELKHADIFENLEKGYELLNIIQQNLKKYPNAKLSVLLSNQHITENMVFGEVNGFVNIVLIKRTNRIRANIVTRLHTKYINRNVNDFINAFKLYICRHLNLTNT